MFADDEHRRSLSALCRGMARRLGFFGSRCLWCGGLLCEDPEASVLCQHCWELFRPMTGGFCPVCGQIYASSQEDVYVCGSCRLTSRPWGRLGVLRAYQGALRQAILAFKYQPNHGHALLMQSLARTVYVGSIAPNHPDILVPVPVDPAKLPSRGFNQSLEMARGLQACSRAQLEPRALVRRPGFPGQTGLSRAERRKNVKRAFLAAPEHLAEKRVLLVDDVYTTGATVEACCQALLKAGATRVDVLVLGRALELH